MRLAIAVDCGYEIVVIAAGNNVVVNEMRVFDGGVGDAHAVAVDVIAYDGELGGSAFSGNEGYIIDEEEELVDRAATDSCVASTFREHEAILGPCAGNFASGTDNGEIVEGCGARRSENLKSLEICGLERLGIEADGLGAAVKARSDCPVVALNADATALAIARGDKFLA